MPARTWKILTTVEAVVILGLAAYVLWNPREDRDGLTGAPPAVSNPTEAPGPVPPDPPSPPSRLEPSQGIPGPAPAPRAPREKLTAGESLVHPGEEGARTWNEIARSDPRKALEAAREFLDRWADAGFDRLRARTALARLVGLGTSEAVALVLEYMEKSDGEFDFSHKSEAFFEVLAGAPRDFAPAIEQAAIRKLAQLVREENLSWNTVYGYAKLAGRFSTGDGERFLKEAYEGKFGSDRSLVAGAFQGLCHTGNPAMIDYLLDSESGLILTEDECRCLALLGREKLVEELKERLRNAPAGDSVVRKHWQAVSAELVGRIGGPEAVPFLEALWRRGDEESRVLAVIGLKSLGPVRDPSGQARARDVVLLGLQDPQEGVRLTAAYALEYNENYACEESLDRLRRRLDVEDDRDVRKVIGDAIRAVEKILKRKRSG
jgi:hypothetical protein